jgi:hypothetical protein
MRASLIARPSRPTVALLIKAALFVVCASVMAPGFAAIAIRILR